jgi:Fe2+ transport system protein FeoA
MARKYQRLINSIMKNINEFRKGDRIKILCMECGHSLQRRLTELGIFHGSDLEIIKNDNFSPVLVKIFDSRIALGQVEASKIYGEKI